MKKLISVVSIILTTISIHAKEITGHEANKTINGTNRIVLNDKTGFPNFIFMSPGNEIPVQYFERWMRSAFKTNKEFGLMELQTSIDEKNISHVHYQETWKGIPIDNTMWIAHVQNGKVISSNGWIVPQISSVAENSLNESVALNFALANINAESYRWQSPAFEKLAKEQKQLELKTWYPKGELMYASLNGDNTNFHLCYRFDVYASKPLSRNYIFIDAGTGITVNKKNRIETVDATGTALTGYLGTKTIITDSFTGGYRLREASRGDGIETYNMQNGLDYFSAVDFTDSDNNWNNVNTNLDQFATDAHYGAEMTYDYYLLNHSRNSIDDMGMKMLSYVHYDFNFDNAFWDGIEMTYGDGPGSGFPYTALDVTGHEISHGVTQYTCNLDYGGESGAMNEGFSDCIGTAIEFYAGGATADWLLGEDLGLPIRDMADPNSTSNPDTYLGTNWDDITQEVHQNSTVLSHWFYLLSVGGNGTNDNGYNYNLTNALGIDAASNIIYNAWRDWMFSFAQYADAREATINAATDLYGACSPQVYAVAEAWHAVGVGDAFSATTIADFNVNMTTACSVPSIFYFQNLSQNGSSYLWNFGDGNTSTDISPSHVYNNYGTYSVSLTTDGGACGASDNINFPNLIHVDSNIACIYNMPFNGSTTISSCNGTLYDNGGQSGNYTDLHSVTVTLEPYLSNGLTLNFNSFNYEFGYDYLYIYDGPSTASPLIGAYDGNSLPNGGTITSTGTSITLQSVSDEAINESGFELTWQCVPVMDTTGIKELYDLDGWSVYPNPSSNFFNVIYSGKQQIETISIYNILGELVWDLNSIEKNHWMINAESFSSGIYFLSAKSANDIKKIKLEKLN